ncbi:winged helix-turn-helix domain-containing protein [Streptomyces sp. NRRL B-24572]|uniref:winged helix-turn-helix domain-containing protein n=1 Tax=Streptomyces sp. NRRL B-24572 TaxID=1962156 RepID=UPI00211ACA62|nr:winged helix-turn-helix domain-containing protein [Streptomyces sp. NRRL B-24572]
MAQRLGVSPGTVSQHLGVLYRAGLVTRARHGHLVLHLRSPLGDRLARRRRGVRQTGRLWPGSGGLPGREACHNVPVAAVRRGQQG